jgi:hypothetical protein
MTARAEESCFATECREKFRPAVSTHNAGESILENAALEESVHGPFHDAAKGPVPTLIFFLIDREKSLEVVLEELVEG